MHKLGVVIEIEVSKFVSGHLLISPLAPVGAFDHIRLVHVILL